MSMVPLASLQPDPALDYLSQPPSVPRARNWLDTPGMHWDRKDTSLQHEGCD